MIGGICGAYLLLSVNQGLPDVETIRGIELKEPLRIYSADGLLISEFGDERRKSLPLDSIPEQLKLAVISSEDDSFYQHHGIDVRGLIRAALSNFSSGATQQGASTITMQVARNFFLTREKTYIRKLREVVLAFKLEQILSKDEILHLYLNKIFLGHRAYGFAAAADVYYGKELEELSLAEIAMLAGLPKAPSSNNPLRNPDRAIKRRNYVLARMFELGYIDKASYDLEKTADITARKHAKAVELSAPHIAEMVRANIFELYGEQAYWQGLTVTTTILSEQQDQAQKSLRAGLKNYDRRHGFRGAISQFDLAQINATSSDDEASLPYLELLEEFPNSREQIPALILEVNKDTALATSLLHEKIELHLKDTRWARKRFSANRRGERPESMSELMSVGSVVYIEPKLPDNENEQVYDYPPLSEISDWKLSQIPDVSGALISMQPNDGRILSLVGGYDFFLNKFNRAVQSIRQPGSNIKPFIYSSSLDKGFTPSSLISGAPIVIKDPTHGTVWRPENYSGKFFGPTRMRDALAKSMNLVSIRLLRSVGIPYARDYLSRFGIDINRFARSLTMALGTGGMTPMELLNAYAILANGGYRIQPYFIDYIEDRNGTIIYKAPQPNYCDECFAEFVPELQEPEIPEYIPEPVNQELTQEEQLTENSIVDDPTQPEEDSDILEVLLPDDYTAPRVMNRANNFLTTSMLKDVVKRGTARKALALERNDLAGKTGTTNDYVDAWFTGYNSKVATTVWVGFDQPQSMGRGESGSKTALPIWVDYMKHALEGVAEDQETTPYYFEEALVNRVSGKPTVEADPDAVSEYFPIEALLPEPMGELGLTYLSGEALRKREQEMRENVLSEIQLSDDIRHRRYLSNMEEHPLIQGNPELSTDGIVNENALEVPEDSNIEPEPETDIQDLF